MKILFIGGTGTISSACLRVALEAGHDVSILCRGTRNQRLPKGITVLTGDAYALDEELSKKIADIQWDCVVNWTVYDAVQAQIEIKRFRNITSHYIFISTTSVYDGSNNAGLITENQQYIDAGWVYSKGKIAAEKIFLEAFSNINFPVTIIRPCHTYTDFTIPTNIQGLGYGLIQRIESQKKVFIHGDGNTYWTLTHSEDFAKCFIQLLNKDLVKGEVFHLTAEEYYTWNEIFSFYEDLLGKKLYRVYVDAKEIYNKSPIIGEPIMTDKIYNRCFDLTKVKGYVKDFKSSIPLYEGLLRVIKWHKSNTNTIKLNRLIENELLKFDV